MIAVAGPAEKIGEHFIRISLAPAVPVITDGGGWNVSFNYMDSPLSHGWTLVDGTAAAVTIDEHVHVVRPGENSLVFAPSANHSVGEWSQLRAARWSGA